MKCLNQSLIIQVITVFIFVIISSYAYGQTCNSNITTTKPDSRYTDNNNGTITDSVTNLMWKECSEGYTSSTTSCDTGTPESLNWITSHQQVQSVNTAGFASYNDWRLPNKNELLSLVEFKCDSPSINQTVFPNTLSAKYWSSTPFIGAGINAWSTDFTDGYTYMWNKLLTHHIRLVRDAN
jgi:hypothetical protein